MNLLGDALRSVRCEDVLEFDSETSALVPTPTEVSVRELARRSGVSHTQISRIENGSITRPAAQQLIDLARTLQRKPAPLLILAGHLTGDDARSALAEVFYDAAELADVWGDWAQISWQEACRLVRDPNATTEQLQLLAHDVFTAGETAQTLWEDDSEAIVPLGAENADLRQLLGTWRFLGPDRREQLLDYGSALRRLQELEELAVAEEWRLHGAQIPQPAPTGRRAFDEQFLVDRGFEGFAPVLLLPPGAPGIPAGPGVYVVLRRSAAGPKYLKRSPAGHFKGEDPTVDITRLEAKWVPNATTLYVGRASNLRSRLNLLARFGRGEPVAHRGGRYLWQLADSHDLIVAWYETPDQVSLEAELVADFEAAFDALPFANLNRPGGVS